MQVGWRWDAQPDLKFISTYYIIYYFIPYIPHIPFNTTIMETVPPELILHDVGRGMWDRSLAFA
jgi:hypothetical protein